MEMASPSCSLATFSLLPKGSSLFAHLLVESTDPWVRTVDRATRLLTTPEFVNSGLAISRAAEHADLSNQLGVGIDDGEPNLIPITLRWLRKPAWPGHGN